MSSPRRCADGPLPRRAPRCGVCIACRPGSRVASHGNSVAHLAQGPLMARPTWHGCRFGTLLG